MSTYSLDSVIESFTLSTLSNEHTTSGGRKFYYDKEKNSELASMQRHISHG